MTTKTDYLELLEEMAADTALPCSNDQETIREAIEEIRQARKRLSAVGLLRGLLNATTGSSISTEASNLLDFIEGKDNDRR